MLAHYMKAFSKFRAGIFILALAVGFVAPSYSAHDTASAGVVSKTVKVYTAVQVVKVGLLIVRYGKQLEKLSRLPIPTRQIAALKNCFQAKTCFNSANQTPAWSKVRNNVVKEWEQQTGKKWPTYKEPLYSKSGNLLKKPGDQWEAHHILPKKYGSPNEWWNIHPVPRPDHQALVHGRNSFLSALEKILR